MAKNNDRKKCPYTGFAKNCVAEKCPKYVVLDGKNPQTGEVVKEEACADTWVPVLIVENTRALSELGAAVESYRNETRNLQRMFLSDSNDRTQVVAKAVKELSARVEDVQGVLDEAKTQAQIAATAQRMLVEGGFNKQ